MIHAFIVYCMVLWPKTCQTIELFPAEDRRIVSVMECARGGFSGAAEFTYEGTRWRTKGVYCNEAPSPIREWLAEGRADGRYR